MQISHAIAALHRAQVNLEAGGVGISAAKYSIAYAIEQISDALEIRASDAAIAEVISAGKSRINVGAAIAEEDRLRGEAA